MTTWDNIIGHEWAVDVLRSALRYDRVGHAYLITGPEQIGKTTLARTFAQALNCTAAGPEERPCGVCRACTLIAAEKHPDVRLVTGESSGRGKVTLKIDQIRELNQALNLTATEARYKIAIIEQFDSANPSAANAFLKTLEEPPQNVILVLTATDAETLLPTIPSRCRTIALRPVAARDIQEALETRWFVALEQAILLAHLADGRIGWAIENAEDGTALAEREEQLDLLTESFGQTRVGRFAIADKLAKTPEKLPALLKIWLSWWRDLTLLSVGQKDEDSLTNIDRKNELYGLAEQFPAGSAVASLQHTEQSLLYLKSNANTRLVLENLLLGYPTLID
jgi:DNA polymerase-3 subunit delta'